MTLKRLGLFILLSVFVHLVLLGIFQFVLPFLPQPEHASQKKSVKVTLVTPPKPVPPPPVLQPSKPVPHDPLFVDTADLIKSKDADPNTPVESDANTQAMSKKAGEGDSFIPNQDGKAAGLDVHDAVASVPNQAQPQPPAPKAEDKPTKDKPQEKSEPKEKPDPKTPVDPKEQKAPQVKPIDPIPIRPDANMQVTKADPEQVKPAPEATPKTQPPPQNTAPRSPPAVFSAEKQKSAMPGGAVAGPDSSIASRETELGRYKAKLFRGIGSRWYIYVQQDNGLLGVGKVRIKFYVRSDGVITNLEIVEGKNNAQLAAISRRSIMEISGQLEPFSESLKVQLGEGYNEEVTFSIY